MSQSIAILQADLQHLELIVPLFDAYRQFYKQPSDLTRARQFIHDRLANNESIVFLAIEGKAALGFIQLYPSFSSIDLKRLWILNDLFVIPLARHRGVAIALMERAKQLAVETQAKGLVLETAVENLTAQRLYEHLGWRREDEFYAYYSNV